MSMLEAKCKKCKQIFVPHGVDPEDLIHFYNEELDEDCGGEGEILGEWFRPGEDPILRNDTC